MNVLVSSEANEQMSMRRKLETEKCGLEGVSVLHYVTYQSAPSVRNALISAGVSKLGPSEAQ